MARALGRRGAIYDWRKWEKAVVSELMRAEVYRTLDNWHIAGALSLEQKGEALEFVSRLTAAWEEIPIQQNVLRRVGSHFHKQIYTLDAIHLVTALVWMDEHGEPLTFVTHDEKLANAARTYGLNVITKPAR